MNPSNEQSILDRHELDFIASADFQDSDTDSPDLNELLDPDRWSRAASLLAPRSRFGPVFGVSVGDVEGAAARLSSPAALSSVDRALKRVVDVIFSSLLLVLLSPVLIAIAVATRFDASGPILYRQKRLGKNGQIFSMLKFRTVLEAPEGHPLAGPRVSRVGRFLRRYSLDEIPQLFNVLGGSMSIVGPRPFLAVESAAVSDLKPGITGLWTLRTPGVHGDSYYRENWSFALDATILWRTVRFLAKGTNAYDPLSR